jgi:L-ribulose-5-phosphate 3-epimerase
MLDRRTFLATLAAAGVGRVAGLKAGTTGSSADLQVSPMPSAQFSTKIHKSILISMLPKELSYADRFALARDVGFEGIEMQTIAKPEEASEIREASQKTGLRIHSVMNMDHWRLPLSSSDPAVVTGSVKGMETSLRNAALWGAETVLLVPAVVDAKTSYKDAYTRSQRVIRERLLPIAKETKIVIAVEEVWNKFLLSPIEFARYVDEFDSPLVKAYFDVGNIVFYAFPQDWIRTLGSRIVKIHLKDFALDGRNRRYEWKNLGEGDIDWPEVRRALNDVKYSGFVTTELKDGDAGYLKDVSARVDRFLAGEKPYTAPPA